MPPKPPSEDVIHVGIVGNTGSGKSTFINAVLGEDRAPVDGGTYSSTDKVHGYDYTLPNGRRIILVDTPGFNCHFPPDVKALTSVDILKKMVEYVGKKGFAYTLVIQSVMCRDGCDAKEERRIKRLCPDIDKVFIVTTHWDVLDPTAEERGATEIEEKLSLSNLFLQHLKGKATKATYYRSGKDTTPLPVPGYVTPKDIIHKLCDAPAAETSPAPPAETSLAPAAEAPLAAETPLEPSAGALFTPPAEISAAPSAAPAAETSLAPAETQGESNTTNPFEELDVRSSRLEEIASTLLIHQGFLTNLTDLIQNLGDPERLKEERNEALGQLNDSHVENQQLRDALASNQKELDKARLSLEYENKLRQKDKEVERIQREEWERKVQGRERELVTAHEAAVDALRSQAQLRDDELASTSKQREEMENQRNDALNELERLRTESKRGPDEDQRATMVMEHNPREQQLEKERDEALDGLQTLRMESKRKLEELQQAMTEWKVQEQKLEKERDDALESLDKLQKASQRRELGDVRNMMATRNARVQELEKERDLARDDLEKLRTESERKLDDMQKTISESNARTQEMEEEASRERVALRRRAENDRRAIAVQYQAEIREQARVRDEEYSMGLAMKEQELREMAISLAAKIEELENVKRMEQVNTTTLRKRIKRLDTKLEHHERALISATSERAEFETQVVQLRAQLDEGAQVITGLQEELNAQTLPSPRTFGRRR